MGKVALDHSVSLDGFITGPNPGPGIPLGEGDERIFAWMMTEPEAHRDGSTDDAQMLSEAYEDVIGGGSTRPAPSSWARACSR